MNIRLPLLCIPFLAVALPLAADTAPYSNDFSGTGTNIAFTNENTDAEWALNNGAYRNTYSNSTVTPSTASVAVTGVAGNSFTLETQFTVTQAGSINSNGATVGFGFFASSSTFSSTSNSYYLADLQYGNTSANAASVGTLRILSLGDSAGFTSTTGMADANLSLDTLAITAGTTYTLRLQGTYTNGTLSMTFGLYDAAGSSQIGTSATASDSSPLTGDYFGIRNRIGLGSGSSTIDFDNFSVSTSVIPEPSYFSLIVSAGAIGLVAARRRRN